MSVEVHIENTFPTPIYCSHLDLTNFSFDNGQEFTREPDDTLLISTNEHVLFSEIFSDIRYQIDNHMKNFYYNILEYDVDTFPQMTSSWVVISEPQKSIKNNFHVHSNSIFSGVFYLNVPENSGDIIFDIAGHDDRTLIPLLKPTIANKNIYNTRNCSITPKPGMILIFPSSLRHMIGMNNSSERRTSIAFNYFLRGNFIARTGMLSL